MTEAFVSFRRKIPRIKELGSTLRQELPCREKWEEMKAHITTAAAVFLKQDTQKRAQAIHISRNTAFNASAKDLAAQWKAAAHGGKKNMKKELALQENLLKLILERKYFRNGSL